MENLTSSIESSVASCVELLSYVVERSADGGSNVICKYMPAAVISPIEITSIEGCGRMRVTAECRIMAYKSCLEESAEAIGEIYATIRQDFTLLPTLLRSMPGVVDIGDFAVECQPLSKRPNVRVAAAVEFEIVMDFVEGSTSFCVV